MKSHIEVEKSWKSTFAIIWSGQVFSTLSSMTVGYAVIFWLSIETKSAEVLAMASIAALLPQLALGPFIGVLIDRFDRRKIMIAADLFIAACSAIIALILLKGHTATQWLYLLLMLRSIGSAFHIPAMQASVPLLAPESQLMRVSGINQMIQSVSFIVGPPLAALLISTMDMQYVLLADVAGAFIACISLLMVRIPNPEKKEDAPTPHVFREMKEGFLVIYHHRGIRAIFAISVLAIFFIHPISVLFPLLTINHFSGGTFQISMVEVSWGAGVLLGGIVLGTNKLKTNRIVLINSMYAILGLTFAVSGVLPVNGYWVFMSLTLIGGISMAVFNGAFMVVLQTTIDPSALGRVFSIFGSFSLIPSLFGLMYTGYIAEQIGVPNAFLIAGLVILFLGFTSFFIPAIREMSKPHQV